MADFEDKRISDLERLTGDLTPQSLFETSYNDSQMAEDEFTTRAATVEQVGRTIVNDIEYASELDTVAKTIIDAINEVNEKAGHGGGGSTVTIADNPEGGIDITVDGDTYTVLKKNENIELKRESEVNRVDNFITPEGVSVVRFDGDVGKEALALSTGEDWGLIQVSAWGDGEDKSAVLGSELTGSYLTMDDVTIKASQLSEVLTHEQRIEALEQGGGGGGSTVSMSDNPDGGVDLTVDGTTKTLAKEEELATIKADLRELYYKEKNGYTLDDVTLEAGTLNNNGTITTPSFFKVTQRLYLDNGKTYKIDYHGLYEGRVEKTAVRFVCTYNANNTFKRALQSPTEVAMLDDETNIIVNVFDTNDTLNIYPKADGSVKETLISDTLHILKSNIIETDTNDIEYLKKLHRKPTFSFIFDDGTDGDINVKALFDSYGLKCGFALIGNVSALTSEKITRYLGYQSEGYEILSHSTDGTGMNTGDVSVIEAKLKNSKQILEANGFDISGFVTPSSVINSAYIPSLKKFYAYGYGEIAGQSGYQVNTFKNKVENIATNRDISQLPRCSLEATASTVTFIKGIINTAINNNGYVCFYGHSYPSTTNNMTVEHMTEILDYLIGLKNEDKINILLPREAIETFYHVRHSDYLDLLV